MRKRFVPASTAAQTALPRRSSTRCRAPGIVVAPRGRLFAVLRVTVEDGRVAAFEVIADPARLAGLELAVA